MLIEQTNSEWCRAISESPVKEVLQRMKIGEQVKKIISGNGKLLKGLKT